MKRILTIGVLLSALSPLLATQSASAVDTTFVQVGSDWFLDSATCRSGTGESAHPWLVENVNDLINVGRCGRADATQGYAPFENQNQFYKLVNDIQINGNFTNTLNLKAAGGQFTAELDGNGKTVDVERITKNLIDNVGLFSQTKNVVIKNLNFNLRSQIVGKNDVGTIVGKAVATHIENVHVSLSASAVITAGTGGVGGLAGELREASSIKNSSVIGRTVNGITSNISSPDWVGGAIGKLDESTAENVYAGTIEMLSSHVAGGVIGRFIPNVDAELSGLISNVNFVAANAGGIIGQIDNVSNHSFMLSNSGVRGVIESTSVAPGGFVGALINVSAAGFRNNYSKAQFVNRTSVDPATSLNGATTTYSGNVFESVQGSGLNTNAATAKVSLTSGDAIPSTWSVIRVTNNEIVSDAYQWVISSDRSFNDGLPMPAQLFNLGVFGAVVAPQVISGSPGSSSSSGQSPIVSPVPPTPIKTHSSFLRTGNKLRVNCISGQLLQIKFNGRVVARSGASGKIVKTLTLKPGVTSVALLADGKIVRKIIFKIR